MVDQGLVEPLPSEQSDRTFIIGLRCETGLYFLNDATLTVRDFPSDAGPADLTFSTQRLSADGFSRPIRVGLWIDVRGPAPSLLDAVEAFGNVARGMAAIISVAGNVSIQEPTADMAYETTSGSRQREYWCRNAPEYEFPSGFGRAIDPKLPGMLIQAFDEHPERDRLHRAMVQYHHALQNWEPGSEIRCLAHVWIGMEALTTLVRSRLLSDLGISLDDLRARYSALLSAERGKSAELRGLNDLDGEIRRRHLFQGDDRIYKLAKDASNGYEHSFNPLWKVREQAVQALEPATEYLRRGILDYSGVDDTIKEAMLHEYFKVPFDASLKLHLTGVLSGTPEVLDEITNYPDIEWSSEPLENGADEEGDAQVGFRTRIAAEHLPPGVIFSPVSINAFASPAMALGTGLRAGTSRSSLSDPSLPVPWTDVMDSGRPTSANRISDIFDQPIRTDGENALSFDASSEYRIETISPPETGIDREDLLGSAERLRERMQNDDWELLCALPQTRGSTYLFVFRRASAVG